MSKLTDVVGQLEDRRQKAAALLAKGGDDFELSPEEVTEFKTLNDEMSDLGKQKDELVELESMKQNTQKLGETQSHPGHPEPGAKDAKREEQKDERSLGEMFIDSVGFKSWKRGSAGQFASVEAPYENLKATFTTAASTLTGYDRRGGMVLVGTQRLMVADLLAQAQTNQNTIRYIQEDTYTNAATAVAEEGSKPEATFDTSEVDAPVRKIAVLARVTDEMFADFPLMRDYINNRLRFMVAEREEAQLLTGSGTAPNLRGILNVAGIQTQALGADPKPDAFYKAIVKVRAVGFFEPDGVVVHPNDWTDIRLLRTADGIYIWGSPAEPGPERLWGLPVVVTTAITENTGLVGAFRLGAMIFYREGIRVETSNSDASDFQFNRIAIRAEQREALAVFRPKAFCTVTGI